MGNAEINISYEGNTASYEVLEDGSMSGHFHLTPGVELVLGVTQEGNYFQRINEIERVFEVDSEKTVFELPSGRIFDSVKGIVRLHDGIIASLTPAEAQVLKLLVENNVLRYSDYAKKEKIDERYARNNLKVYVRRLRGKIDVESKESIIVTHRGFGYGLLDR